MKRKMKDLLGLVACLVLSVVGGLIFYCALSAQSNRSDAPPIAPKYDNISQAAASRSFLDEEPKSLVVEIDKQGYGVPSQPPKPEAVAQTKTISQQAQMPAVQVDEWAKYKATYQEKINPLYAANGLPPPVTPPVPASLSERRRAKEIWAEAHRRLTASEGKPHVAENGSYHVEISTATGCPKTVYVQAYRRTDGTYVRSHYRSPPRRSNSIRAPPSSSRRGVAENGSYYGQISKTTGRPKTVAVRGYYRKNGTYVRSHYRSPPRR